MHFHSGHIFEVLIYLSSVADIHWVLHTIYLGRPASPITSLGYSALDEQDVPGM